WPLTLDAINLRLPQVRLNSADHTHGDFVLKGKDIFQYAVIVLGPEVSVGFRIDKLGRNPDAISRFAHAALKHVADTEFISGLLNDDGLVLVDGGRVAGDHRKPFYARQPGDDFFHHAIREILLWDRRSCSGMAEPRSKASPTAPDPMSCLTCRRQVNAEASGQQDGSRAPAQSQGEF